MTIKVFGIGLGRTGTKSLNRALINLGFNACHYPSPEKMIKGQFKDVLSTYDALTDISVVPFYKELDQQFPGSKFILTVRSIDSWIVSYTNHYFKQKDIEADYYKKQLRVMLFGSDKFNDANMIKKYNHHYEDVVNYFKNRKKDLLIMNIIDGDGWNELCTFLGKEVLKRPFPYVGVRRRMKKQRNKYRTAIVLLTWNRLPMLKETINTFRKFHKDIREKDFIIVDNGSTDGTVDFLKTTSFETILNESNLGAQMGKYIGWARAVEKDYDFIIFIEDDHSCYRTVPILELEKYLDDHEEIGIIRLNDKPYLKGHQITKLAIKNYGEDKLNKDFKITKSNYHFTSHPSIFRASLVSMLQGCVFPEYKPTVIDVDSFNFDKNHKNYKLARKRTVMDFGVSEKEYMRLYLIHYRMAAQLIPQCFKWINTSDKRMPGWRN